MTKVSSEKSQIVIIYAFHESADDYDRFTSFFKQTLQDGFDNKKKIIFVQEDIGAALKELRAHHDDLCEPDVFSNPRYRKVLRKYWNELRMSAYERIMRVISDPSGTYHHPTEFAELLMTNAQARKVELHFEDISFETWLRWESAMVAFEDNLLMLSCGQIDADTFVSKAQETVDAIKRADIERDIKFSQQLQALIEGTFNRLVITHRGICHFGMHDILLEQGIYPIFFSVAEPKDLPICVKVIYERILGRPYLDTETMLVMRMLLSAMLRPALKPTIGDTLECERIKDAISSRIAKEEFFQLFQTIADAKSPGRVAPILCSWLKQKGKLGEEEKYLSF